MAVIKAGLFAFYPPESLFKNWSDHGTVVAQLYVIFEIRHSWRNLAACHLEIVFRLYTILLIQHIVPTDGYFKLHTAYELFTCNKFSKSSFTFESFRNLKT